MIRSSWSILNIKKAAKKPAIPKIRLTFRRLLIDMCTNGYCAALARLAISR